MLLSNYYTIEDQFKRVIFWFFVSLLQKYKAQDKIKIKLTAFFESVNSRMKGLVRCNRLQSIIMYTDTWSKQCNKKLEKSYCWYYDPRKSIKTGNDNPKNRKHCFYCWSTCQVSKKHIGFAFWLLFSFYKTKIESYNLTCGLCSKEVFSKTNP